MSKGAKGTLLLIVNCFFDTRDVRGSKLPAMLPITIAFMPMVNPNSQPNDSANPPSPHHISRSRDKNDIRKKGAANDGPARSAEARSPASPVHTAYPSAKQARGMEAEKGIIKCRKS